MTSIDRFRASSEASKTPAGSLFDPVRLKMIAQCWIVIACLAYVIDLLQQTHDGLSDGVRRPFGDDFVNYWSGAFLAAHGRAAEIYDFAAFHVFEQSMTGPAIQSYHYSYPPVLLLLTLPLALIPYVPALGVWLAATWYGFYRALKLTSDQSVLLLSLATPALFVNAVGGQNGALTAALLGGGLVLLDRRPIVAGLLFGCLAYKPHLALMLPFALIAGRRWLTVGVTGLTAILLIAASVVVFGPHLWLDYAANLSTLRVAILEDGTGVWHRMLAVFVFARRLGADVGTAYALQGAFAMLAAFFVARSWWRDDPPHIRGAMVILGTCLATPYLQDYDLVMSAFVVVWLKAEEGHSRIPATWIRTAMAVMLLLPLMAAPLGKLTGLALGPLFILPVFALLIALAESPSARELSSLKAS
jgi:arabinofuranan 3-O-arabinosyltransferase